MKQSYFPPSAPGGPVIICDDEDAGAYEPSIIVDAEGWMFSVDADTSHFEVVHPEWSNWEFT